MVKDITAIAETFGVPLSSGALAGLVATVPMTVFMWLMQRLLPNWQKYALPPEQITDELARRTNVKKNMDKQERLGAALVSHFGYGTSMGAVYGSLVKRIRLPLPPVLKGVVFGIAVWAVSYLGWLPAMKMPEAATEQPGQRNALMIAAHVVWGAGTGVVTDILER